MPLETRVQQFPNETLSTRMGKLYCVACKAMITNRKSCITHHVLSKTHIANKDSSSSWLLCTEELPELSRVKINPAKTMLSPRYAADRRARYAAAGSPLLALKSAKL